jgi:hypothetical protein
LRDAELALKDLAPAPDSAKWIALDDEYGRFWRVHVTTPSTDLFFEALENSLIGCIGRLRLIRQLCAARAREQDRTG